MSDEKSLQEIAEINAQTAWDKAAEEVKREACRAARTEFSRFAGMYCDGGRGVALYQ